MTAQTLSLKKSIEAHGETVSVLTFREPTGKDLAETGLPMLTESEGGRSRMVPNTRVISELIARLAGIPNSSVGMMSVPDFMGATEIVLGFFSDSATPATS